MRGTVGARELPSVRRRAIRPVVACFVHGRGRGHAARARMVVPALTERGCDVHVFGGGQATTLLDDLPRFATIDAFPPGPGLLRRFARRLQHDVEQLSRLRPDVVVSDGDAPSVHAARWLGIPSVAVGHGLLFAHGRLPLDLPLGRRAREIANAASSSWPCARRVVVHFHPVIPRTRRTAIARPDLGLDPELRPTDEGFVLAYFRDDNGRALLDRLASRGQRVVAFGAPGSVSDRVELRAPNREDFVRHLVRCGAVVGSAGNHLPAECAMLGKPMLAVWADGDGEHEMNARLLTKAGIGAAAPLSNVPDRLLDELLAPRAHDPAREAIRRMRPASEVVASEVAALLG